jgi:hypothetical protein
MCKAVCPILSTRKTQKLLPIKSEALGIGQISSVFKVPSVFLMCRYDCVSVCLLGRKKDGNSNIQWKEDFLSEKKIVVKKRIIYCFYLAYFQNGTPFGNGIP